MDAGVVKTEPADSEQDEEEDVYEVERIIDMRVEEGKSKDSPVQKPDSDKMAAKQTEAGPRANQSHGFSLDSDEKEVEEPSVRARAGEERRDKAAEETGQRPGWERRTPTDDRRWKRREDSDPRLFMACDDTPEPPDPLEGADKSIATPAATAISSSRALVPLPVNAREDEDEEDGGILAPGGSGAVPSGVVLLLAFLCREELSEESEEWGAGSSALSLEKLWPLAFWRLSSDFLGFLSWWSLKPCDFSKDSPVQKPDSDKMAAKQTEAAGPRANQSHGFSLDSDEKEVEEPSVRARAGEERRDKAAEETGQRPGWERRTPTDDRRWKRREDSDPRLFMACDDTPEPPDPLEGADKSRGQATLSLGMDLNLDWMTLEDFQKHLNGEDEILSGPPLSPSELRDAVKSGDYMSVKLALNSKEEYNLDQEACSVEEKMTFEGDKSLIEEKMAFEGDKCDSSGMSLCMLAAAGGQNDILRLLIRKGVRVNGRQNTGTTALMHAAEKDSSGMSLCMLAAAGGQNDILRLLIRKGNFLTTVAILLEAGSHVNALTLGGETALMKACKRGNADIVRLLLEYGSGALLFIFHANFLSEITARLCGPCSVQAVMLNDNFQLQPL
ncbi:hypothetical protein CRUP_008897 [Coryphaenoides rupestris]|nr:hypothetical protein CRUP_008897 [Coryphaenoides rupestris]